MHALQLGLLVLVQACLDEHDAVGQATEQVLLVVVNQLDAHVPEVLLETLRRRVRQDQDVGDAEPAKAFGVQDSGKVAQIEPRYDHVEILLQVQLLRVARLGTAVLQLLRCLQRQALRVLGQQRLLALH